MMEIIPLLNWSFLTLIGWEAAEYVLYDDDGVHKDYEAPANYRTLKK